MTPGNWEAFWERIAYGISVEQRDAMDDRGPDADLVRYAIAQQEAAIPPGWPWKIEIITQ